jgi:hypothetical protein
MRSLTIIVSLLFLTAIFSGPIAWGVSRIHTKTRKGGLIRRSFVTVLGIWGTLNGMQFALAPVPLFPRLVGIFSITTSVMALRNEYGFWQGRNTQLPPED